MLDDQIEFFFVISTLLGPFAEALLASEYVVVEIMCLLFRELPMLVQLVGVHDRFNVL
ncbi:hypothetical protein D3C76_1613640 [compost metagenome]